MAQPLDCGSLGHAGSGPFCNRCGVRIAPPAQQSDKPKKSTKNIVLIALLSIGGVLLLIGIFSPTPGEEPSSVPASTPIVEKPSSVPTSAPIAIDAKTLIEEREANAARYDMTCRGRWVTISGTVDKVDDGAVYIRPPGTSGSVTRMALHDLPTEVQAAVEKRQRFTATCKVEDFRVVTFHLRECRVSEEQETSDSQDWSAGFAESPETSNSQDWPAWVTEAPVKPSAWTTVAQAKDALRRCHYELRTLDQYRSADEYRPRPSPDEVEEELAWAVFDNGWASSWKKPDGLLSGAGDIWGYGHSLGCWAGVPGAWQAREETLWNPQWRSSP